MHQVEGAIGQYTQGKATRWMRIPGWCILGIPVWRDATTTLLLKAKHSDSTGTSAKIQLVKCSDRDEQSTGTHGCRVQQGAKLPRCKSVMGKLPTRRHKSTAWTAGRMKHNLLWMQTAEAYCKRLPKRMNQSSQSNARRRPLRME
jgi:hypothetical protein